jgi:AraC-like DNA-binding protein
VADELKIRAPLNAHALRIVDQLPSVTAEKWRDGQLLLGDQTVALELKYRRRIGPAEAWQLTRVFEEQHTQPDIVMIAVADRTTAAARRILVNHGIGFVDASGNAHIDLPGVYLHIEKPAPKTETRERGAPIRLSGIAGIVAQALLLDPTRAWRIADVVEEAGISMGLVHRVFSRLQEVGIIEWVSPNHRAGRALVNPSALLDLWIEENRDRRAEQLRAYVLPSRGDEVIETVEPLFDRAEIAHALTGTAAAARLAPYLTIQPAATYWIHAPGPLEEIAGLIGADAAESGANVILMQGRDQAPLFRAEERDGVRMANVFRIYHDALLEPSRGPDQAEHFRREVIGF